MAKLQPYSSTHGQATRGYSFLLLAMKVCDLQFCKLFESHPMRYPQFPLGIGSIFYAFDLLF